MGRKKRDKSKVADHHQSAESVATYPSAAAEAEVETKQYVTNDDKTQSAEEACDAPCWTRPQADPAILCNRKQGHDGEHVHYYEKGNNRSWGNPQTEPLPLEAGK